jgi:hypothetical protein
MLLSGHPRMSRIPIPDRWLQSNQTVEILTKTRARAKTGDVNFQRYGGNAVNRTRNASTSVSTSTVKSRMHQIRKTLRIYIRTGVHVQSCDAPTEAV